jgi:hypothetical protein
LATFAEEAYYFDEVELTDCRGSLELVNNVTDTVRGARFDPEGSNMKSDSTWDWWNNLFEDTGELSGLKVLISTAEIVFDRQASLHSERAESNGNER